MDCCFFFVLSLLFDLMRCTGRIQKRDYDRQSEDNEHVINGLDKGAHIRCVRARVQDAMLKDNERCELAIFSLSIKIVM